MQTGQPVAELIQTAERFRLRLLQPFGIGSPCPLQLAPQIRSIARPITAGPSFPEQQGRGLEQGGRHFIPARPPDDVHGIRFGEEAQHHLRREHGYDELPGVPLLQQGAIAGGLMPGEQQASEFLAGHSSSVLLPPQQGVSVIREHRMYSHFHQVEVHSASFPFLISSCSARSRLCPSKNPSKKPSHRSIRFSFL